MKLYLASESEPRRDLLVQLGIQFEVLGHRVNEQEIIGQYGSPKQAVMELAKAKAESACSLLSPEVRADAVIIGCDTMNYRAGRILGKPLGNDEAQKMLEYLLTDIDTAWTGICVIEPHEKPLIQAYYAEYRFDNLTSEDIAQYVASGEPLKCAGGLRPTSKFGLAFCTTIKGSYQCIHGLPMEPLVPVLRRNGLLPDFSRK